MADSLNELASGTALEGDQAQHGVGALLALLKDRLSPEAYDHLKNAVPDSEKALSAFEAKAGSTGGNIIDTVKNMAGKLLGRQEGAAVQDHFASVGLSADQLQSFLPRLYEMLAAKLPPNIMEQIKQHVPGFEPAAVHAADESH
jgi:hypothetical protein